MKGWGELVGVYDTNPEKAAALAAYGGTNAYGTIELLMDAQPGVSVVAICSPNGMHVAHAAICLQLGKHVICEKPLCIDVASGAQLVAAAANASTKVWVIQAARFFPATVYLKHLLDSGQMGKIISFQLSCNWNRPAAYFDNSWRGTVAQDGGVLYTQFSHYIDALYWYLGSPKNVRGFRKNYLHKDSVELEDTGTASLEMHSGAIGTLHWSINTTNTNLGIHLMLIGEKGTVVLGGNNMQELQFEQWENGEKYSWPAPVKALHPLIYAQVAAYCTKGEHTASLTEAAEALATVEFIDKVYKACPLT